MSSERRISDADTTKSGTLPNAANTTSTNYIDLGAATPFPVTEGISVKVSIGTANGANSKNINIRLQDCADTNASNFANIALLANPVLRSTDNAGAGHSASNVVVQLPPNVKRYLRATALGEANGGDSSNGTFEVRLQF